MGTRALTARSLGMKFVWWVLVPVGVTMQTLTIASVLDLDEVWRYHYANPETSRGVRTLVQPEGSARAPRLPHDFDGDGTEDEFSIEYFRMGPMFGTGTSGLLRVRSGHDGSELLVRGIPTPIDHVTWAGDLDGNGTDDLFVGNTVTPLYLLRSR